jgi:hypothetical protein
MRSLRALRELVLEVERNEVPFNDFFQKALAYEKTIAKEGGILIPH